MKDEIKEILDFKDDADYKRLSIEDILLLKEYIAKQEECYCNRTDCSGRIRDSKKYDSLQQRIDKAISKIDEVFAEEDWYVNYEYNDLEDVLKEVKEILQGSDSK